MPGRKLPSVSHRVYSQRMNASHYRLLTQLLSQPTAPFREQQVMNFVTGFLKHNAIPFFSDPAGNIVIGSPSVAAYRALLKTRGAEPVRLFIAHMDHPGFHGQRWLSPTRLLVKWHGGSPIQHLRNGRMWLANSDGVVGEARLARAKLLRTRHAIDSAELRLARPLSPQPAAESLYGGFRFRAPVWRHGKRLYTHVADDLIGVFAVLATAHAHFRSKHGKRTPFVGLLTRGEEVGFIGVIAHLELGWLAKARRPLLAISLETSRTLPSAIIGKGPVVRLGDRRTVFDAGALRVLSDLAEKLLAGRHQRRVMDGGTCEATAAIAWGLPAIGISVPLGNYHNQGFEGGPDCAGDNGPAPEFVHIDDINGLLLLCRGLMQPGLAWTDPWSSLRIKLRTNFGRYRRLLANVLN